MITLAESWLHRGSRSMLLAPDQQHPDILNDLSNERQVTADTPPTFLFHTDADTGVPAENSVMFYLALRKAKVPAELHIYESVGTGRPRRHRSGAGDVPDRLAGWLRTRSCSPLHRRNGLSPAPHATRTRRMPPADRALWGLYPVHNGAGRTLMESVMDMQWWHWAVLGLALGLLELATPGGFFILFFGIGALLVSLLVMLGVAGPLWLQWMLFPVLSVLTLFFFRGPLLRRMRASERTGVVDSLTADIAVAKRTSCPGGRPRRAARHLLERLNVGLAALHRGQRCAVGRWTA